MDYLEPFLVIDTAWCTNASPGCAAGEPPERSVNSRNDSLWSSVHLWII